MLTGGLFDSKAALHKAVDLGLGFIQAKILAIVFYVTVNGLILHAGNGACAESVAFAEHLLRKMMRYRLIITGEIQIDIRGLISLESEEYLERDIIALLTQFRSAYGAILIGKIDAAS